MASCFLDSEFDYRHHLGVNTGHGNRILGDHPASFDRAGHLTLSELTGDPRVGIRDQIRDIGLEHPEKYLDFVGTLFLFTLLAALCGILPGYEPPTGSLSTTAALAICVFWAVPIYGIKERGIIPYLKRYAEPKVFMLPLNIVSDLSRTLALAIRLFGNVMSGSVIAAILLSVAPLFFPVLMKSLDLLIGAVQAYIFAVLATVYIAAATKSSEV